MAGILEHRTRRSRRRLLVCCLAILTSASALSAASEQIEPTVKPGTKRVLEIDLSTLDAEGLIGPPDGKRALSYEFCIPSAEPHATEVRNIDPSARFFPASPGRIGCAPDQMLVIGDTHQRDFANTLQQLADLPYVQQIIESHFE